MSDKMRHVVVAMNHLIGMSYIRHHDLPRDRSTIVCDREEVRTRLAGIDIHDLAIHVAGDLRNIPLDKDIIEEILWFCTGH